MTIPEKLALVLGDMSRYSTQILICIIRCSEGAKSPGNVQLTIYAAVL